MDAAVIKTTALNYRYSKDAQTLFDINLQVEKGSIYGFLGPNGSGKTTTLSLLLGLLQAREGKIEIFGKDLRSNRVEILKKIGSLVETPSLYGHLTAKENLEVYKPIYGASSERITEVLKIVKLEDTGKKTVKRFSLGMKQRLSIALALLPKPELLILDEPSNGLDPAGIIELRALIKELNRNHGMTIIISSHILSEVEKMVSHVGIIFKGKMLFQGSLAELNQFQQSGSRVRIHTSDNIKALNLLGSHSLSADDEYVEVAVDDLHDVARINKTLTLNNLDVYMLEPRKNNLEQLFIDLTTEKI